MYRFILHIIGFIIFSTVTKAQEYSSVHYTEKDGLAGDIVYDMTIDRDGFMWFATKTGLSKFDGITFTNFTTKEGLPANEVLKIFADSKGRIWISPFMHEPVVYENGKFTKIQAQDISEINLQTWIKGFYEYEDGVIMINNFLQVLYVKNGKVSELSKILKGYPKEVSTCYVFNKSLYFHANDYIYKVKGDSCFKHISLKIYNENRKKRIWVGADNNGGLIFDKYPHFLNITNHSQANDTTFVVQAENEAFFFNRRNGELYFKIMFDKLTQCISDEEGNWWMTSLGNGVFRIPSFEFKNYALGKFPEIFTVNSYKKNIFSGKNNSDLFITSAKTKETSLYKNYNHFLKRSADRSVKYTANRIYTSFNNYNNDFFIGSDAFLLKLDKDGNTKFANYFRIKSLDVKNDTVLIATGGGAILARASDLSLIDTIWEERCSSGCFYNGKMMIGSLGGLIEIRQDGSFAKLALKDPAFSQPVTSMKRGNNGELWIATSGNGLIKYRNDRIIKRITTDNGLTSDICTSLFINGNEVWVGTEKGLNFIRANEDTFSITAYTTDDGLPSNHINDVYVEGNIVYVASAEGLTSFDRKKIEEKGQCRLHILNVKAGDSIYTKKENYSFPYNVNNIQIDFIAISYKSGGKITYYYKLEGIDNDWNKTVNTTIDYPALSYGNYALLLKAINKFGVESEIKRIYISIATPWWKTWWFLTLAGLITLIALWYFINRRYQTINNRKEEKRELQKKITDLEQLALRAQMNPHFIFNCLSSIQSFIIKKDIETTNKYLNDFAYILRKTLDNSSRQTISIADEVNYITRYLDLETMRFGDKFKYAISVDEEIPSDYTLIPNMILQPFVENSIRHGMRYRDGGGGLIKISFIQNHKALICTIEDNGIGRKNAAKFKSQQHIEYQSKGMQLTINRLELLGVESEEKTVTEISDIINEDGEVCGTKVKITFPLSIIDKLN